MSKEASESSLDLLKTCQENGWMKIDNPEKLSAQLTARYGDKAPDLIMEAVKGPSGLMKKIGQEPTTPTNTLNYLVSDDISIGNIQKLGGSMEATPFVSTVEPIETSAQATAQTPAPEQTDLSQLGNTDVYGNKISSSEQGSSSSASSAEQYNDSYDNNNQPQYSDPWSEFLSNYLFGGNMWQLVSSAIALHLVLSNQHALAFGPHYTPFPHHCHPFCHDLNHFDGCVDKRSKFEKALDKVAHGTHDVAHIAHDTAHITHSVGHIIGAFKGKNRGMG